MRYFKINFIHNKGYSYIAPSIIFSSNVLTNHIDNETISKEHASNASYNHCLNSWLKVLIKDFILFKFNTHIKLQYKIKFSVFHSIYNLVLFFRVQPSTKYMKLISIQI